MARERFDKTWRNRGRVIRERIAEGDAIRHAVAVAAAETGTQPRQEQPKETIEEFLARGGTVTQVAPAQAKGVPLRAMRLKSANTSFGRSQSALRGKRGVERQRTKKT